MLTTQPNVICRPSTLGPGPACAAGRRCRKGAATRRASVFTRTPRKTSNRTARGRARRGRAVRRIARTGADSSHGLSHGSYGQSHGPEPLSHEHLGPSCSSRTRSTCPTPGAWRQHSGDSRRGCAVPRGRCVARPAQVPAPVPWFIRPIPPNMGARTAIWRRPECASEVFFA